MTNQEHLDILKQGVVAWNTWISEHIDIKPNFRRANLKEIDLRGAYLIGADLSYANLKESDLAGAYLDRANLKEANLKEAELNETHLHGADLSGANLRQANLSGADVRQANLKEADLSEAFLIGTYLNKANLSEANLSGACLIGADLQGADLNAALLLGASLKDANLRKANLCLADLSEADLNSAILVGTTALDANFTDCMVYGISAWDVQLDGAQQIGLIITPEGQPTITVDSLEVAQFIYLMLNNKKIREVIDTITSKVVLILGRFTNERKKVLDALRDELRKKNYVPVMFDFETPKSRDVTETVTTLARMARFVIADITDAKSIPHELMSIVPNLPSVPVQPLILNSQHEYGMFEHFTRFSWFLPVYRYTDEASLLQSLNENVIAPAEQKAKELAQQ